MAASKKETKKTVAPKVQKEAKEAKKVVSKEKTTKVAKVKEVKKVEKKSAKAKAVSPIEAFYNKLVKRVKDKKITVDAIAKTTKLSKFFIENMLKSHKDLANAEISSVMLLAKAIGYSEIRIKLV